MWQTPSSILVLVSACTALAGCMTGQPGLLTEVSGDTTLCLDGSAASSCANAFYTLDSARLAVAVSPEEAPENADTASEAACTLARDTFASALTSAQAARTATLTQRDTLHTHRAQARNTYLFGSPEEWTDALRAQVRTWNSGFMASGRFSEDYLTALTAVSTAGRAQAAACGGSERFSVSVSETYVTDRWLGLRVPTSVIEGQDYEIQYDAAGRFTSITNSPTSAAATIATNASTSLETLARFAFDRSLYDALGDREKIFGLSDGRSIPSDPGALDSLSGRTPADIQTDLFALFDGHIERLDAILGLSLETLTEPTPVPSMTVQFDPSDPQDMLNQHRRLWALGVPVLVQSRRVSGPQSGAAELDDSSRLVGIVVQNPVDYEIAIARIGNASLQALQDAGDEAGLICLFRSVPDCTDSAPVPVVTAHLHHSIRSLPNGGTYRSIPVWRNMWVDQSTALTLANGRITRIDTDRPAPGSGPFIAVGNVINGLSSAVVGDFDSQRGVLDAQRQLIDMERQLLASEVELLEQRTTYEEALAAQENDAEEDEGEE